MAFSTEDVLSLSEAYDKLVSFMTGHGWTVFDNIPITGSRDKVLFSAGTDGKLSMYYRVSTNLAGNPFKDPGDAHVKFPYVFIRGYHSWNASTHTGSGEFGVLGPIIWGGEQYSATGIHYLYPHENKVGGEAVPLNSTYYSSPQIAQGGSRMQVFDGRRKMWWANSTSVSYYDLASPDSNTFAAGTSNAFPNGVALVKDPVTDREYVYTMDGNVSTLLRYDIENSVFQTLPTAPWGAGASNGANMIWDGGDFIYAVRGNTTTSFARYSISNNVWTSLAVTPVNVVAHAASLSSTRLVYVPASVTGLGEDVIYALLSDSVATIYRYDVTSNAWRTTTGTGALTDPSGAGSTTSHLMWDRIKYLYLWRPNQGGNFAWRSNLSTAPNTFTNLGTLDAVARTFEQGQILNYMISKTRCSDVIPGRCFFHGDADSIRFVYRIGTNPGQGRYYWSCFGRYDSSYRATPMGVTATSGPGVRITVPVDSVVGYAAGQAVTFANWSGSHFETTSIYQLSGSNAFICNLTSSFPSGSKVSVDPAQHCLSGDTGMAIAPISYNGYKVDYEPDYYYVKPEIVVANMDKHAPSTRNVYMPMRFLIYNAYAPSGVNSKLESLGYLRGVYSLPKRVYPAPQNEDILVFGGNQYMYFNQQETSTNNTETRGVVLGPL